MIFAACNRLQWIQRPVPPPVDCAMHDQSWAGHREPLMAGPAGRRTTPVVCRCPAMVSSRTLFCWRKISRYGVQSDYEWTAVYWLLWLSLPRPICLWPCTVWRFWCDSVILWDADCWVTLHLWRQRKKGEYWLNKKKCVCEVACL